MLKRTLPVMLTALFLSVSMGYAQVPGNPNGTPRPAAESAAAKGTKPFTAFSAVGSGTSTVDAVLGPCSGVACTGTDICECLTISDATLTAQGLGKSTLVASINLDTSTLTNNGAGAGFCDLASGPGTLTAANGSTLTIDLTGAFCSGFNGANYMLDGGYTIVGGSGKLSNAGGTGNYSISAANVLTTPSPAAVVMNGAFSKNP